jgi:hypothetical protein
VEENKVNCDYAKLSAIDSFKRKKSKYLTEKHGHLPSEDEGVSRLQLQKAEHELLQYLNEKVNQKYSIKKKHERL